MSTSSIPEPDSSFALVTPAPATVKVPGLMEIVVNRDLLIAEVVAAHAIASTKTTIPILSNLLLEAKNGGLYITASNLDQTLQTTVGATVKTEGCATVPSRKFLDYIRLLPSGIEINIKLLENSWIRIKAGRSTTKMSGMPRDNFPKTPFPTNLQPTAISIGVLRTLIGSTAFCVSREESRYTLNGSLLLLEPDSVSMVATDGHRLAVAKQTHDNRATVSATRKLLVPGQALRDIPALLGAGGVETVDLFDDDSTIYFSFGGRRLYSTKKLTGAFPNYEAVIPTQNKNTLVVVLPTAEFQRSLLRVMQFADERSGKVKLQLAQNALKLSCQSTESGESEETLDTPYALEKVDINLNALYLVDFCKSVGSVTEVRMSVKDGQSAAVFEPVGNPGMSFLMVVMPMR
jgi:DNA polymerase-3 subunit beta